MAQRIKFVFHVKHDDLLAVFLDKKRGRLLVDVYAQKDGLTMACTQYVSECREAFYNEYQGLLRRMIAHGNRYEIVGTQTVQGHRPPTKVEIDFGMGSTHYLDFPINVLIRKDGTLKGRIFNKEDNLWYYFK